MSEALKKRMKRRADRFVDGYLRHGIVFGRTPRSGFRYENCGEPMTRRQAERFLVTMPCKGAAIFELVPVQVNR